MFRPQVTYVNGSTTTATYGSFSIGAELSTQYTLSVSGYQGDGGSIGGDALAVVSRAYDLSNGYRFTTIDRVYSICGNCASILGGGWWYVCCSWSVLNMDKNAHWIALNYVKSSSMSITKV